MKKYFRKFNQIFYWFFIFHQSSLLNQDHLSRYNTSVPRELIPFLKELSMPLIAVVITTTAQIPMMIPSIVNIDLILFPLIALRAIIKLSLNSKRKLYIISSCLLNYRNSWFRNISVFDKQIRFD